MIDSEDYREIDIEDIAWRSGYCGELSVWWVASNLESMIIAIGNFSLQRGEVANQGWHVPLSARPPVVGWILPDYRVSQHAPGFH